MKVLLFALLPLFLFSCELEETPVPSSPLKKDYAPGATPGENTGGNGNTTNPTSSNAPFILSSNDFSDVAFDVVNFYPVVANEGANTAIYLSARTPDNSNGFDLAVDIRNTSINQINLNGSYGIVSGFKNFSFALNQVQAIGYPGSQQTDFISSCRISFSSFNDNNVAGVVYIRGLTTYGYSFDFGINFDIERGSEPLFLR